jgi:hypothetical protein
MAVITASKAVKDISNMHRHQLRAVGAYFDVIDEAIQEILGQSELKSHEEYTDFATTSGTKDYAKTLIASNIHHIEACIYAPYLEDFTSIQDFGRREPSTYQKARFVETNDVDPDTGTDSGELKFSQDPQGYTWRIFWGRMPVRFESTSSKIEVRQNLIKSHLYPVAYAIALEMSDPGSKGALEARAIAEERKEDYKLIINGFEPSDQPRWNF